MMRDADFRKIILNHWRRHGRHDLPWRKTTDPYRILVSEVMLQQTQVERVIPKFREFLKAFPTFRRLAAARIRDVLQVWQGLGYNRRALMLHRCAQVVVRDHRGKLPTGHNALCSLPGIGPYTAGAIMAFAFNEPHPIIETNIRRVYLYHYFPGTSKVDDRRILAIVERTVDRAAPRRWYSALMDYGAVLAKAVPNPNQRSRQYVRQSAFAGSVRQLRGQVVRLLLEHRRMTVARLVRLTGDARTDMVVATLVDEGMVRRRGMVVECQ